VKNATLLFVAVFAGFVAAAPPLLHQDLSWDQHRGYDVPFVPTPTEVVDEMLKLANLKPGDVLYDLGCGDGRIVIAAAKRYGVKATGIDIDPVRIAESNQNATAAGLTGKVRFIQEDLFQADFKDATVVTMYLLTSVNLRLRPKLLTDLKPGTRLVSHSFEMGEWAPDKTSEVSTTFGDVRDVHFWVVPANVTGHWEWDVPGSSGSEHYTLDADQQFQVVSASGKEGSWPLSISDIKLSGDAISFKIDTEAEGKMVSRLYEGKAAGDTITGTIRPAGNPKGLPVPWKAVRDPKTARSIAQ
jgi:SAM-dependent methyltransferase